MASAGKGEHVLIIVENLPLPFDRRVWQEARTLARAGYEVSIICPKGKGYESDFEELESVAIYRHPLPLEASGVFGYFAEYAAALYHEFRLAFKIFRKKRFQAIQACNPPDLIFLVGLWFKFFFGVRFVFDHHDLCPELWEAKFNRRGLGYAVLKLAEKLTFMTADLSIATNESYKSIAVSRGGMAPDKVTVVRSGPDLARLEPVAPDPEMKNGAEYLVGYLGVMGKQEGIDHFLEAAQVLVRDMGRDDVNFVLVGGGTELEAMREMARNMGLDDRVAFTGRVSDRRLVRILCSTDVCVNPDVANDMNDKSTMNKIMEYMALGKPIVQYDLTEGRVSAGDASLYAEKNDPRDMARKIAWLLDHPGERAEMGAFGQKRVTEKLHWGVEAPKYLSVYGRLFGKARS